MKRVLACIDNSAAARPVIDAACAIAPLFDAVVEAVHVAEDGDSTASAAASARGVAFQTVPGDVIEELTRRSAAAGVVVVAVGARDRPLGMLRTGHVALALVEGSDVPVLIVPPDAPVKPRLRRVLIAMEGTASNARNLKRAVEVAAGADVELIVVHVDDEESLPSFSDQVQYESDAYAQEFLARYVAGAPAARLELRIGTPAEQILKAAESIHPDVLAMGWRSGDEPGRGAVAREVVERTHLPVLLVAVA